ncbi:DUF6314 family protein [Curtobacterium sp. Leaf261]|uniref:DUF6314 family protein n=1 Tax=Curtobacterium sp. Leaf261 TaxID=1736311 RepID=UPI0006FFC8FB|nr:DUF6314 family protein [Curtobacterium sp. Leaf261]KQO62806.1 hypothetical protein ASF23_07655 [Curtobacterium sp. Leaf261]
MSTGGAGNAESTGSAGSAQRTGGADVPAFRPTDVLGAWTLARTVVDRTAGDTRVVAGTTTLTSVHDGRVLWEESGTMTWSGGSVPVSRTLVVTDEGADGWMVRFADGREFHPWRPGTEVVHDCAPDVYRGFVDGSPAAWSVVWEATGPAKDYRMESRLTRP